MDGLSAPCTSGSDSILVGAFDLLVRTISNLDNGEWVIHMMAQCSHHPWAPKIGYGRFDKIFPQVVVAVVVVLDVVIVAVKS